MLSLNVSMVNSNYISVGTQGSKGFDEEINTLLPANVAKQALTLKPYLFILSNRCRQTIIAYCLKFVFSFDDGSNMIQYSELTDPGAALSRMWSIREQFVPMHNRVVSVSMVLNSEARSNQPDWIPD